MDLTEKKAKEILDFLARKAGCDCIEINYANNVDCWIPHCYTWLCSPSSANNSEAIVGNIWSSDFVQHFKIHKKSYAMLLEKMLKTSSNGFDVYGGGKILLPSCSILEAILIEMDLKV